LKNLLNICRLFLDDIKIKRSKTNYNNIKIIFNICQFILKYIKNLNLMLLNFKLINCIIFDEKSQFCMSSIKIVNFIYDFHERRSEEFKIIKILK